MTVKLFYYLCSISEEDVCVILGMLIPFERYHLWYATDLFITRKVVKGRMTRIIGNLFLIAKEQNR